jgi:hypothetical protein
MGKLLKQTKRLLIAVVILCVLLAAAAWTLSNWFGSSNFGKAVIPLGDGSRVYVVHESWGLHEDELSVTRNPDGCVPPDPVTDFIDTYGDGSRLIYSFNENGLVLYDDEGPAGMHAPSKPWPNSKITVKKTRALADMYVNPKQYGVTVLNVPLNEVCWRNFFRRAGTSLRTRKGE